MSRAEIVQRAWRQYHARQITLAQLLRVVAQWRPQR